MTMARLRLKVLSAGRSRMSEATVKADLTAIFRTLNVSNRTQAVRVARERG
jgi:DNA-binding NarL/FixJ family response regulator